MCGSTLHRRRRRSRPFGRHAAGARDVGRTRDTHSTRGAVSTHHLHLVSSFLLLFLKTTPHTQNKMGTVSPVQSGAYSMPGFDRQTESNKRCREIWTDEASAPCKRKKFEGVVLANADELKRLASYGMDLFLLGDNVDAIRTRWNDIQSLKQAISSNDHHKYPFEQWENEAVDRAGVLNRKFITRFFVL